MSRKLNNQEEPFMLSRKPCTYRPAHFYLITFVLFAVTATSQANAQILERGNDRFLKLGDREYSANANHMLSDDSAKDILLRIRLAYDDPTHPDNSIVDLVWSSLHKIYTGEVYEEIMMTALRIKCDCLFSLLARPNHIDEDTSYFYGQLITYQEPSIKRGGAIGLGKGVGYDYSRRYYTISMSVELTREKFEYLGDEIKAPANETQGFEVARAHADQLFAGKRNELIDQAIDIFVHNLDEICTYFTTTASPSSYVLKEQWDPFLTKLPAAALQKKADCGEVVARRIAGRLITLVMKHTQNIGTQSILTQFAQDNALQYETPKDNTQKRMF